MANFVASRLGENKMVFPTKELFLTVFIYVQSYLLSFQLLKLKKTVSDLFRLIRDSACALFLYQSGLHAGTGAA
jgi:hypothetical protein